jgi:hypothetical protein
VVLLYRFEKIRKNQGLKGLCLYLKGCSILIIKFISKDPTPRNSVTYGPHISLTKRGIPRILPLYFRTEVSKGNSVIIRLVLTMLGLYRVLPFEAPLKTSTITDSSEFKEVPYDFRLWFISFNRYWFKDKLVFKESINPFMISSAGNSLEKPIISSKDFDLNESTLWSELWKVMSFKKEDKLKSSMYWFHSVVSLHARGLLPHILGLLQSYPLTRMSINFMKFLATLTSKKLADFSEKYNERVPAYSLGRLSLKIEPGKVRVFAIVDTFTQWVLKPLHEALFTYLRGISTDATFDQNQGLKKFFKKIGPKEAVFSYDLSAATDRLPIKLQVFVLNTIFGKKFGDFWSALLCDRVYTLKSHKFKVDTEVRYMCGQPMGAYSSWAMLALTHHIILQYAAYKAYEDKLTSLTWFSKYCILGDDIIIGDKLVAKHYFDFMTNVLKVKINISKSVISYNGIGEFAKRIVSSSEDYTPLSLKEFESWGKVSGAFIETLRKFPELSMSNILKVLGKGPRSSGHFNKLYYVIKLIKPMLDPNLSTKDKLVLILGGGPEAEHKLKYILWAKVWDFYNQWAFNNAYLMKRITNDKVYDWKVKTLHYMFQIPFSLFNIIEPSLESTDFYKTMIFGFTPKKAERIHESLEIRKKDFNEVSIEDLLFILDEDFNSLIAPNLLSSEDYKFILASSTNKEWRANFEQIEKFIKFYHYSLNYFKERDDLFE